MPMFVVLAKVTEEGAKTLRNVRQIAQENMSRGERLGMKVHGWYLTQGHYDIVVVVEAPDADTMLAQNLAVAGVGNVHTETLRAFTLDEVDQTFQKLSQAAP